MKTRITALLVRYPFLADVLRMLTGTSLAQLVTMALAIPLARVYSPETYGLFGIYGAITGVAVTVAALRYDLAVVLPARDVEARVLLRLARTSIVVVSLLTSLGCVVASSWVSHHYGSVELSRWLWVSGLMVFVVAEITNIQFWLTRTRRFGVIAGNRVLQSAGVALCQLLFGLVLHGGLAGLVVGTVVGQLITLLVLLVRTPELRAPLEPGAPTLRATAYRHRRMPLLNGPNALVDAVRNNGITMILGTWSVGAVGQFNMAWRMLQVPVSLIGGSVSQVFLQKLATVEPGRMLGLVRFVLWRTFLVALLPFAVIYAIAPWVFPVVFGPQWGEAGDYARALLPWLFMNMLTSPVSNIFIVTEQQQRLLVFALVYAAAPLLLLWFSPWPLVRTVWALGLLMAGMLMVMLVMALLTARQFDRSGASRA